MVLAALAAVWPWAAASALEGDRVRLTAQVAGYDDSNLARAGGSTLSDHIVMETVGVTADLPWSRQHLTVDASASRTQYQRQSTLDNDGRNIAANWTLGLGNDLTGGLAYHDSRTLQNLNNFRAVVKDVVNHHDASVTLSYAADARWHLNAAYTQGALYNSELSLAYNDNDTREKSLGISYELPGGNLAGYRHKAGRTVFTRQEALALFGFTDNSYRDAIDELYATWLPGALGTVNASLYRQRRSFDAAPGRDLPAVDGGSLSYRWSDGGPGRLTVTASRDVGGTQFLAAQTVVSNNLAVRPDWIYSEKLRLGGNLAVSGRQFSTGPNVTAHQETVRDAGVSLTWSFQYAASLGLNWQYEGRRSDTAGYDYDDRLYSLSLNLQL